MRLVNTEKAWETAQRIYSDPVLLHAIKNVLDSTETIEAAPVVYGQMEEIEPCRIAVDRQCCSCGTPMGREDCYCPNCGRRMREVVEDGNRI